MLNGAFSLPRRKSLLLGELEGLFKVGLVFSLAKVFLRLGEGLHSPRRSQGLFNVNQGFALEK